MQKYAALNDADIKRMAQRYAHMVYHTCPPEDPAAGLTRNEIMHVFPAQVGEGERGEVQQARSCCQGQGPGWVGSVMVLHAVS